MSTRTTTAIFTGEDTTFEAKTLEGQGWPLYLTIGMDATIFLSYSSALRLAKELRIACGAEERQEEVASED